MKLYIIRVGKHRKFPNGKTAGIVAVTENIALDYAYAMFPEATIDVIESKDLDVALLWEYRN